MSTSTIIPKTNSKIKKWGLLVIKLGVTLLCFWYISKKIDFTAALEALQDANWVLLFFAALTYVISKIIASFRLNLYFKYINLQLTQWQNIKLYWLGMFYNLFLPGSISGDAYKVVLLNQRMAAPYKQTSAAVFLDRLSGALGLGVLLSVYGLFVFDDLLFDAVLVTGSLVSIGIFYFVIKKIFPLFLPGFWPTLLSGLFVQTVQAGGIYLILFALKITLHQQEWIFIFLSASVISVLPLSLGGGLGTREVVFAEGASFFQLDPHVGVIISLLFYLSSVAGAAWGAWFVFHDPLKR